MLSDRERAALDEVERRFLADDPEFAGLFDGRPRRRLAAREPRPRGAGIGLVLVLALGVFVLLAGSPAIAVPAALGAAVLWASWRYGDFDAGFGEVEQDGGRGDDRSG